MSGKALSVVTGADKRVSIRRVELDVNPERIMILEKVG